MIKFFNEERLKQRMESFEYWKQRRLEEQEEAVLHEMTLQQDLENACRGCHMIRSTFEVIKGTCDNCDFEGGVSYGMAI